MRIDSNGLITGTGTSLGAWTNYTTSWGGTGWAVGNATNQTRYFQIGKLVYVTYYEVFGSTSTAGAGQLTFTLPITMNSTAIYSGNVQIFDTSAGIFYAGSMTPTSSTVVGLRSLSTNTWVSLVDGTPITFATGDQIRATFVYQAA
jgi:hypothetical protein